MIKWFVYVIKNIKTKKNLNIKTSLKKLVNQRNQIK